MICAHPDCNAKLGNRNRAGVCLAHRGWRPPEGGRPVKTVEVPYPTSNSGVDLRAKITLPRAPWETEHA